MLLVHGWGGNAGRLTSFVAPLTSAGFSVVAFDAPAHGASAGRYVSLPEIERSIATIAREVGSIAGIVGHSIGATASALAMRHGLAVPRVVFLAPPADLEYCSRRFASLLKIPSPIRESMNKRLSERHRFEWSEFRIVDWAHAMSSSLLLFHDRGDHKVPQRAAVAIVRAWPGGKLVTTHGLGHHKILRDPQVISRAVSFFRRDPSVERSRPHSNKRRRIAGTVIGLRPALVRRTESA